MPEAVLSVVMPVRNARPFLDEAVQSILAQSFRDFEFIILDDASGDGSRERLREWAQRDGRIRLIESPTPLGPVASSNRVAAEAACPIVARMDADDVAHPERFARELDVLRRHPSAVLVGSLADSIDAQGRLVRRRDRSAVLRAPLAAPIMHSSIMYRADAFRQLGGYRAEAAYFEDNDLYDRMSRIGQVLMIPKPLLRYRYSGQNARLNEQQCIAEEAVERGLRWFAHGTIEPRRGADPADGRVAPAAIVVLGSLQLWAGQRPMMVGRLLRRARLGWNRQSASALARALWAAASPGSLRAAVRLRDRWRDMTLGRRVDDGAVYEWRPARRAPAEAPTLGAPSPAPGTAG